MSKTTLESGKINKLYSERNNLSNEDLIAAQMAQNFPEQELLKS